MTTIACNLKEMAGDSRGGYEGVGTDFVKVMKLFTANGSIYGMQGEDCAGQIHAVDWIMKGAIPENKPMIFQANWHFLELSPKGIFLWNNVHEREPLLHNVMAVGSGRKVALYGMIYLGMSPAEAVLAASKVDVNTGPPIFVASLKDLQIKQWKPKKPN